MATEILRVKPVNVQARYRGSFSPPNYRLVVTESAASVASELAAEFNLKSTNMVFNQNTMGNQYLSFRYILPKQPIRFFDALIGVDQAEVVFSNPATISELREEYVKVLKPILEKSKPTITEHVFEATIHGTCEGAQVRDFLNRFVKFDSPPGVEKGFSLTLKKPDTAGEVRIGLEVSTSITDGLYCSFAYLDRTKVGNLVSLNSVLDTAVNAYKESQRSAHIEILEALP